jgi:hypothetical protein
MPLKGLPVIENRSPRSFARVYRNDWIDPDAVFCGVLSRIAVRHLSFTVILLNPRQKRIEHARNVDAKVIKRPATGSCV